MKALLFANTDWYLWNFRLPLARALREQGWEVVLVSPPGNYSARLRDAGFRWEEFAFSRPGVNPLSEALTLARLARLYRELAPDLVHHFTIKCVLYGGLAAERAGVRSVVSSVTGLGHIFTAEGLKFAVLRRFVGIAYRRVLTRSEVVFQNPDDRAHFGTCGVLREGASVHLIRGSGVDLEQFAPPADPPPEPPVTIVLAARLLREKGIEEFVAAARTLAGRGVPARFVVAGDLDPGNPSSHTADEVDALRRSSPVEFIGHHEDMPGLWRSAHIACLPSWREGTPRTLLEAGACGLPLVASDVPGCREVVRNGDNGILVPARAPTLLAKALEELVRNRNMRIEMGHRSREIVCNNFSEAHVLTRTLEVYQAALARGAPRA
ncbi:MAG: glycosyltransferase family 4 protein [Betaproteobacteria bacterium]|nr:glycosyltransferase family 4 protein [Betaproteobacteria bacterium]